MDVLPHIGFKAISAITAPELLSILRGIENRGAVEIAHRTLQMCGQIFRYGIAIGVTDRDVAADLKGALKARKQEGYAHLKESELSEFMQKLESYDGELQTKLALKFLILTFTRTSEVRGAQWTEIDLSKNQWRIPASRMKMREEHTIIAIEISDRSAMIVAFCRIIFALRYCALNLTLESIVVALTLFAYSPCSLYASIVGM